MAQVICENCGRTIRDTDERCLYCNAINVHRVRNINNDAFMQNKDPIFESSFAANNLDNYSTPTVETTEYAAGNVTIHKSMIMSTSKKNIIMQMMKN